MQDKFPQINPDKLSMEMFKLILYCLTALWLSDQKQCITNLGEVLKAAGSSINSVVKVNVFLADMKDFAAMNEVYEQVCIDDRILS